MLYEKIKVYLSNNSIDIDEVNSYFELKDDGNGAYISSWNQLSIGIEQPTDNQLSAITEDSINLKIAIEAKKEEINNQRDDKLLADITITLSDTSILPVTQVELQVTKDTFFTLQPLIEKGDNIEWVLKNNNTHTFTTADLVIFRDALIARNDEIYQARKRKDAVEALTNVADVEAYDITTIYP